MNDSQDVAILEQFDGTLRIEGDIAPRRIDPEVVVVVFIMITRDLLLKGSDRISLHVRMQQPSTITVILERELGSISDFQGRLGKVISTQMSLEERAHLRIPWAAPVENHEVQLERHGVDAEGDYDETKTSRQPVSKINSLSKGQLVNRDLDCGTANRFTNLGHLQVPKLIPEILDRIQADESSGTKQTNPFNAARSQTQC